MNPLSGKKILFVITKSNWGGAQVYLHTLAVHLRNAGAEVVVILGGTGEADAEPGLLASRLEEDGIRVVMLSSFARDISLAREFRAFSELLTVIKKERPDILHLNSSKAGGLGGLAGKVAGVEKIIFTAHGWPHREPRSLLSQFLIWWSSWLTILLCHRVIVVSGVDYSRAPVLFSHKKIILVRNGVASFVLRTRTDAREALTVHAHIPADATWVFMQAELHRNKGVDIAILALKLLGAQYPKLILVVVGEGQERLMLEKLITNLDLTNRVFLLGFVSDSRSYLHAADLYLMSSRKEGLPIALLEAGIAELPVIATATGGIPDIIQNKKTGLLVPVDDSELLSQKIKQLLENPEEAKQLASSLATHVKENFSEDTMLRKTIAVYTEN